MSPAARSDPTFWLTTASSETSAGDGARCCSFSARFPLSVELRELLLPLDDPPPPPPSRRRRRSSCLENIKPSPVRCSAASELLPRPLTGVCLRGDDVEARGLLCCREYFCFSLAEAIMERALRRAEDDRCGLLSLLLDSTTLGMINAGIDTGARGGRGLVEAWRLLPPLRLEGWGRGGEAAAMLSGDSSPPRSSEDPFSVAVGDCRPPCDRGSSSSSSPLRACCAWDRGAGLLWL